MGGCGLAAGSQLALLKALEITLEIAQGREGRRKGLGQSLPTTLTIPMCSLPHPPECPPAPHSLEPDHQQGSGCLVGAGAGSCLHRVPLQGTSGATWPLADGSEGAGDVFAGGSRPLLGRRQYKLREASLQPKSHP